MHGPRDFLAVTSIVSDATGTVYFIIFEAPAANWHAAWHIGQEKLDKDAINDSI